MSSQSFEQLDAATAAYPSQIPAEPPSRAAEGAVNPEVRPGFELDNGVLRVSEAERSVRLRGAPVTLTAREFALLLQLLKHAGHILSRKKLLEEAWGDKYAGGPRTVDIHVSRLRSKLRDSVLVETLRTVGYRLHLHLGESAQRSAAE